MLIYLRNKYNLSTKECRECLNMWKNMISTIFLFKSTSKPFNFFRAKIDKKRRFAHNKILFLKDQPIQQRNYSSRAVCNKKTCWRVWKCKTWRNKDLPFSQKQAIRQEKPFLSTYVFFFLKQNSCIYGG